MKKILVAVVLGIAAWTAAQDAQPAQQPASQAPVIKDPAEYNAYVSAAQQTDAAAKISGLEAFLKQYPSSVMKNQALELLMGAYQGSNNVPKTLDAATRLVNSDPTNVRGYTVLCYFDRLMVQGGDPNSAQELTDAKKYCAAGLDALGKTQDKDILKMKDQMGAIFKAGIGFGCLQDKDYKCAQDNLRPAADANPTDFSAVYPLALSYLQATPQQSLPGIWYGARAMAIAPPAAVPQIQPYIKRQYVKYHGDEDGWTDVLAKAKAGTTLPADFTVAPAPTPADQAHKFVTTQEPDKMDFAIWEFVLSNGSQEDQDKVWNAIKGKAVQMNGTVISVGTSELQIAGSADDIDAKKADITLKFDAEFSLTPCTPAKKKAGCTPAPKEGASLDFQGEPSSYTPNPFVMVMEKGTLLTKAAPPAPHKPAATHKPAAQ
jgi:hypothetical protein